PPPCALHSLPTRRSSDLTFWLLDIPGAVLWGSVMGILGLLPILGTPLVWGPAAVILLLDGEVARALILIAAGSLIVSTIDNVLRDRKSTRLNSRHVKTSY